MNLEKLTKKLSKEFNRNKKKTVILAVISLVAVYFWAPLIQKWVFGKQPNKPVVAAAQPASPVVIAPPTVMAAAGMASSSQQQAWAWREIAGWIEQQQTSRIGPTELARDPFQAVTSTPVETIDESGPTTFPLGEPSEASMDQAIRAGLELTSTFVGPRSRVAYISGSPYQEQETLTLAVTSGLNQYPLELKVLAIRTGEVVLEYEGRPHTLRIERALGGRRGKPGESL